MFTKVINIVCKHNCKVTFKVISLHTFCIFAPWRLVNRLITIKVIINRMVSPIALDTMFVIFYM